MSVNFYYTEASDVAHPFYTIIWTLSDKKYTLIYPQASKYVETQKDPFATLFSVFRNNLNSVRDNVLVTCGYSFGDEHINNEIELAMSSNSNKSVLLAFAKEGDQGCLSPRLTSWLDSAFGERVFVLTDKAIHISSTRIAAPEETSLKWWSFSGLTEFLKEGEV